MPKLSKDQWLEWRNSPVTDAVYLAVQNRMDEAKEIIVHSSDPDLDRVMKGMIRAFYEVLDLKPDFTVEEDINVEL